MNFQESYWHDRKVNPREEPAKNICANVGVKGAEVDNKSKGFNELWTTRKQNVVKDKKSNLKAGGEKKVKYTGNHEIESSLRVILYQLFL